MNMYEVTGIQRAETNLFYNQEMTSAVYKIHNVAIRFAWMLYQSLFIPSCHAQKGRPCWLLLLLHCAVQLI